jgi:hypothetical protein
MIQQGSTTTSLRISFACGVAATQPNSPSVIARGFSG